MTTYTPPAEAVEAAARAMTDDDPILTEMYRNHAMSALTAAGPIIAAAVWDQVADYLDRTNAPSLAEAARRDNPYRKEARRG